MPDPDDGRKRAPILERAKWFQLTEAASVGIEMAAAIGIGAGLGIYLERNVTHWAPWTTYIGLSIGMGAAVLAVVRTARNFTRVIEAEEEAERRARGETGGRSPEAREDPQQPGEREDADVAHDPAGDRREGRDP